jgi:RNA polymerase sigma factor for flagellar operon FliA
MPPTPEPSGAPDIAEAALWTAFRDQGSAGARERLFGVHAAFARNIARRHHQERSRGDMDLHDLHQLAYTGLLEALDRFDPRLGIPFRPFAAHRISGSIRDGIIKMSEMREQLSWRNRVRRERVQSISGGEAREPIEKLTEIVVGLALGFMLEGTGLFVHDEGGREDVQGVTRTAYDSLAWKEMTARLGNELRDLPERERIVLQKHYMDSLNFDSVAALMGVSKGRISQMHRMALERLRKRMSEHGHTRIGSITR